VLIQWSLAKGFVTLPKSTKPERQRENLAAAAAAAGVALGEGDLRALDALEEGLVTGWDPITEAPV
jgi:diketogulonate reductase-like aldo/keto reductase